MRNKYRLHAICPRLQFHAGAGFFTMAAKPAPL